MLFGTLGTFFEGVGTLGWGEALWGGGGGWAGGQKALSAEICMDTSSEEGRKCFFATLRTFFGGRGKNQKSTFGEILHGH